MADAAQLLRLLEPPVRPGQTPGPARVSRLQGLSADQIHQPIEQRGFDSLLAEAKAIAAQMHGTASEGAPAAPGPVDSPRPSPLAILDHVDNASLRNIRANSPSAAS